MNKIDKINWLYRASTKPMYNIISTDYDIIKSVSLYHELQQAKQGIVKPIGKGVTVHLENHDKVKSLQKQYDDLQKRMNKPNKWGFIYQKLGDKLLLKND